MTVAADTREAVQERPFLRTALRAGVVNYTAAARFLVDRTDGQAGERGAVAAALRRYAEDLEDYEPSARRASVSMTSGVDRLPAEADQGDGLLVVGDAAFAPTGGDLTAVIAGGEVDAGALADVLARLRTAEVEVVAAGGAEETLAVVVERHSGADAVRAVEDTLQATH